MGGLGRAGTIASRLIVELGWDADQAVRKVREVRPGAIETAEQLEFVHACVAAPEATADQGIAANRDRAIGALTGLAIGDALSTTLEFSARDKRSRLVDMEGGGPFRLRPGQWTVDTSMALSLADSLMTCGELDEHDLMARFLSWWKEGALQRFKQSGNPISGSTDPLSAGNGSLMRLSPVAIRYWNDQTKRRDAAARQSRTTHGAAEAVDACVLFADILADAIAGKPRSEILADRPGDWAGAIGEIANGSWRGKRRSEIKSSGYVARSLEAALWCVGRTSNFEEAVLLAANLGGDADTVAAITGQLAGALYGQGAIPTKWLGELHEGDMIIEVATSLFDGVRVQTGPV